MENLAKKIKTNLIEKFHVDWDKTKSRKNANFLAKVNLTDLLILHLRLIDNGKINRNDSLIEAASKCDVLPIFGVDEQRERKEILGYIKDRISQNSEKYEEALIKEFEKTMMIISALPEVNKIQPIISDLIIADTQSSLQFFIALGHKAKKADKKDLLEVFTKDILEKMERFIFLQDFNEKGDSVNHAEIFANILLGKNLSEILGKYSFDKSLRYVESLKDMLFSSAYGMGEVLAIKLKYLHYKYQVHINPSSHERMQEIFKDGWVFDHVLPIDFSGIFSEARADDKNKINSNINSIGNLLLVSKQENSTKKNSFPYKYSVDGGLYDMSKDQWSSLGESTHSIDRRSQLLYDFLMAYFFSKF